VALLTTAALLLCGCRAGAARAASPEQIAGRLSQPFETHIAARAENLELEGDLTRRGPGSFTFCITAPQTLAGLTVQAQDGGCSLSYGGMGTALEQGSLLRGSPPWLLCSALDALTRREQLTARAVKDTVLVEGRAAGQAFSLSLDRQGVPLRFKVPACGLELTFSEFRYTGQTTES